LVSVILPTRNRADLLPRAIASVLAQTYRNLELIVVNDASSDNTREVLEGISDPRLSVIHREVNKGASAARNAGIAIARGEFVAFQDDDDVWLVDKLQEQVSALQSAPKKVGWCLGGYIQMKPQQYTYIGGAYYWNQLDYSQGLGKGGPCWWLIATPAWLVKREALERAGNFDERIRSWEDWELGLRLSEVCDRIFVDKPLYLQDHIRGSGLILDERARAAGLRIIMEKHGHIWAGNRRVLARHFYTIGRMESLCDPPPAGREYLLRSLRTDPLRIRTWAAIALCYIDQRLMRKLTAWLRKERAS
jgi:glycosyltransferase involved in cell wall biosynthesis